MAQRGRKKKYLTEEEAKEAQAKRVREYHERKVANAGREGVTNPCRHKKIKYDGITIDIGTMDRTKLNTAFIDLKVTISYSNDTDVLELFRNNVHKAFVDWLYGQTVWDRKNRIAVMDYDLTHWNYKGKYKTLAYQYHVRRDEITDWESTVDDLMKLVECLVEAIKKTCDDTGLELRVWAPNAKKVSSNAV